MEKICKLLFLFSFQASLLFSCSAGASDSIAHTHLDDHMAATAGVFSAIFASPDQFTGKKFSDPELKALKVLTAFASASIREPLKAACSYHPYYPLHKLFPTEPTDGSTFYTAVFPTRPEDEIKDPEKKIIQDIITQAASIKSVATFNTQLISDGHHKSVTTYHHESKTRCTVRMPVNFKYPIQVTTIPEHESASRPKFTLQKADREATWSSMPKEQLYPDQALLIAGHSSKKDRSEAVVKIWALPQETAKKD